MMVTVQRLYHTLPAQSTPSSAFLGHPPTTAVTAYISITKNENSYAIKFEENGRRAGAGIMIIQWQNGEPVTVYPTDIALAKPVWPKK